MSIAVYDTDRFASESSRSKTEWRPPSTVNCNLQIVICFAVSLKSRVPLMLVTVVETDGEFESVLPNTPSIGPYRLDV